MRARALIFHMSILCFFPWVWFFFILTLEFDLFLKTLTLLHVITFEEWELELWYFAWVFFVKIQTFFTLWPWHWSLASFLKTCTILGLIKIFKSECQSFHSYFTWILLFVVNLLTLTFDIFLKRWTLFITK